MATIYKVSELAGVSLATVSRVINDSGKVKPKTREKVLAAMDELGYRPNTIAQSLASKRSNSVGILIPELYGPFFGVLLSSIEQELRDAGKHVIITAGHSDPAIERESIEFLKSRRCDALIVHAYALDNEELLEISKGDVPIIFLTRDIPEVSNRCISLDNELGGYMATQAVLEQGHRSIAYISGPLWKIDSSDRLKGHKRALREFDIEFDEKLCFEGNYQERSGNRGMYELLGRGIPFTAVVCANDEMAAGALDCARKQGFIIPAEMAIVGFDDVFFTRYLHPKLSSVSYSIDGMGRAAAQCVLRDVYGKEGLKIQNRFQPKLIQRESLAPPA